MIVPVILDAPQYRNFPSPILGQHVRVELYWTVGYADWWAGLRPGWTLEAALHAADRPTVTHIGATVEEDTELQPTTGSVGGLRFGYKSPLPIPDSLHIEGALRITGVDTSTQPTSRPTAARSDSLDQDRVTTGTIRRLQLVSILVDMRPAPYPGWAGMKPIAGTEWFYDLASPPAQLHHYRPPADSDEEPSTTSAFAVRQELILIDLEVGQ